MKLLIPLAPLLIVGCSTSSDEERLADLRRQMEDARPPFAAAEGDDRDEAVGSEQPRLEDVYNQEIERLGGTRPTSPAQSRQTLGSGRFATPTEWNRLAENLVMEVEVGMSAEEVRRLMGEPHEVNEHHVAGNRIVIWTWKKREDPEGSFIHLDVSSGIVNGGGSTGYDIRTGFKTKLPLGGSDTERARLKNTLEQIGVQVED